MCATFCSCMCLYVCDGTKTFFWFFYGSFSGSSCVLISLHQSDLWGVMTSQDEASSFRKFFQYVEDRGLRTYDGLVIQNASDIARESDRVRNQNNWTYLQEKHQKKRRQEDAIMRYKRPQTKTCFSNWKVVILNIRIYAVILVLNLQYH